MNVCNVKLQLFAKEGTSIIFFLFSICDHMLKSMSMVHHCKYPLFVPYLDLGAKVTQNAAQYPLHHVNYAPAKFGVAECNPLGDVFT